MTATVLRRTGAYVRVLESGPDGRSSLLGSGWAEQAERVGASWRERIERKLCRLKEVRSLQPLQEQVRRTLLPTEVRTWWGEVRDAADIPLRQLMEDVGAKDPERRDRLTRALLKLCLVADEACAGIGLRPKVKPTLGGEPDDSFLRFAETPILERNRWSSLCLEIDREKVRVLPKTHTPQRGLTLRSLTHHLALCPTNEVEATWRANFYTRELDSMNLLLLPWPLALGPWDFELLKDEASLLPGSQHFFGVQRGGSDGGFKEYLEAALKHAKGAASRIDAIVLPELALSAAEFVHAEEVAFKEQALLIAGVDAKAGDLGFSSRTNACLLQAGGFTGEPFEDLSPEVRTSLRVRQTKHHRWCLDRHQILQYRLGGILPPSSDYWEHTAIERRSIHFLPLGAWLTMTILICEDLARQDPVSEVVRTVGPTFVVALLMDGPQLRSRWPARYASVLAEDPGCSVLTLTSLGMSQGSHSRNGERDRSRVIALWKDVWYGEQELELPQGSDAAVLSLVCRTTEEFTADRRGDGGNAHFPVFAGFHPLSTGIPARRLNYPHLLDTLPAEGTDHERSKP